MAKKDKEQNLNELDVDELNGKLIELKETLFKQRFRAASAPVKNVMKIRAIKRNIARINTFINQKRSTAV